TAPALAPPVFSGEESFAGCAAGEGPETAIAAATPRATTDLITTPTKASHRRAVPAVPSENRQSVFRGSRILDALRRRGTVAVSALQKNHRRGCQCTC